MLAYLEQLDIRLFFLVNRSGQNGFFDIFMPFMSDLSNFYLPLGIFLLFLLIKKSVTCRTVGIAILLLISLSEWVSSDVLKPTFNRPRPYHSQSHVHHYDRMGKTWQVTPELKEIIRGESRSLPSSHATNIFAAAFFLSYFLRKTWPLFYLIAFLVGYSRVYLGVHFPLDVLAGAFVGTLCGMALMWPSRVLIQLIEKRRQVSSEE
jgi:undecaprenyl-diphosphatase